MGFTDYTSKPTVDSYKSSLGFLGGQVVEHFGTYFFEVDGVSVPLPKDAKQINPWEVMAQVEEAKNKKQENSWLSSNPFKAEYQKRKENDKTGFGLKSLTGWPQHFIDEANKFIEQKRAEILALQWIKKGQLDKKSNDVEARRIFMNTQGLREGQDARTLTSSQRNELAQHDRTIKVDIAAIGSTEGNIDIKLAAIRREEDWKAKNNDMLAVAEAVERSLDLSV